MNRRILPFAAVFTVVGLSSVALAQQALPTIGGAAPGANDTGARERAASSAIEQQVEYRTSLQRDLAQREQLLRTSEKDLETRKARLKSTHVQLLSSAQKVQEQAAKLKAAADAPAAADAEPDAESTAPDPAEQTTDVVDPSIVMRLSKDLEAQSYEIQVASAQIKRLQQEVDYLRGVIAQMSGVRR
jgi:hypothetical protein